MHLDEHSDIPFYQQLFDQLRADIEDGTRPAGAKLPSIRGLAGDLGCARNTVEQAYHLLTQEGYVESRPGSGYVVQNVAYLQPTAASPACAVLLGSPARRAEKPGPDYLGGGAVFPTGSKDDADDVSYDTLQAICRAVSIPVVAIGGISLGNVSQLSGSGICGIAVISAIYGAADIRRASLDLKAATEEMLRS